MTTTRRHGSDAVRRLGLIRHGSTSLTHLHAYCGRTDPALDRAGRVAAAALSEPLQSFVGLRSPSSLPPFGTFCSPLTRCRETATLALPDAQAVIVPELAEINFGEWEGLTFEQVAARDPDAVRRWAESDAGFRFPGGESIAEFHDRVHGWCDAVVQGAAPLTLAVTHAGVIRAALCRLLALPADRYLAFAIEPASLTVLDLHEGGGAVLRALSVGPPLSNHNTVTVTVTDTDTDTDGSE